MKKISIFLMFLVIVIVGTSNCRSKFQISDNIIGNSDDFSNRDYKTEQNMISNMLSNQKYIEKVKVYHKDSIYQFKDFKKVIGFDSILDFQIIRDTKVISKYGVKDCKILLITNK